MVYNQYVKRLNLEWLKRVPCHEVPWHFNANYILEFLLLTFNCDAPWRKTNKSTHTHTHQIRMILLLFCQFFLRFRIDFSSIFFDYTLFTLNLHQFCCAFSQLNTLQLVSLSNKFVTVTAIRSCLFVCRFNLLFNPIANIS